MKKMNFTKLMFNIYIFLFVFTMINREFLLFGMDLRYLMMLLGVFLICYRIICIIKHKQLIEKDKNFRNLAIFYIWCILCNVSWIWNDLKMETDLFIKQMILIINNFILLIVLYLNKDYIKRENVYKMIIFSCIILLVSFIFISMGYELSQISGSDVRAIVRASEKAADHKNMFGGNFRIAGYAEDPNYASIFFILGSIATIKSNFKKRYKAIFLFAFFICFGLSWSKTTVLALIAGIVIMAIMKLFQSKQNAIRILNGLIIVFIIIFEIVVPKITILNEYMPSTLTTRFKMWDLASDLFTKSPIVGNGIDSFKSYINEQNNGRWYVQCHSTYWQILSELGIIGMLLFINIVYHLLNKNRNNDLNYFLLFIYITWAMMFETIAMQFTIGILYLMQLKDEEEIERT